ncbi:hypothetical protein JW835_04630, partial [bacterium]|nr:hypothetical protein [bacterium]
MKVQMIFLSAILIFIVNSLYAAGSNDNPELQGAGPIEIKCHCYIGDYVWYDADEDGNQDPGESGIGNVRLVLEKDGSYLKETTTNSSGWYQFRGDGYGTYKVIIDESTIPKFYWKTYPSGTSYTVTYSSANGSVYTYDKADYGYCEWDKSSLEVTGECKWNSTTGVLSAVFTVTNTGTAAMQKSTTYDVYVNGVKTLSGTIDPLNGGESRNYEFTGNENDFIKFVAQQRPGHPGSSNPQVEIKLDCFPPASIDIEKHTNGIDADSPTGPVVPVGSTVTWTYIVTNTGGFDLTNVDVNDNKIGLIGTIPSLSIGASQTLTATGTAQLGQYANIATAIGHYFGGTVNDSDPSHYIGYVPNDPGIHIEKSTNGA